MKTKATFEQILIVKLKGERKKRSIKFSYELFYRREFFQNIYPVLESIHFSSKIACVLTKKQNALAFLKCIFSLDSLIDSWDLIFISADLLEIKEIRLVNGLASDGSIDFICAILLNSKAAALLLHCLDQSYLRGANPSTMELLLFASNRCASCTLIRAT